MSSTFAFRLKHARLRSGLSLQQVADEVGLSKQMINKYEQGKSMPASDTLISLARLLQVKVDQLFRKSDYEIGEISFRKRSKLKGKREIALKEEIRTKIENYLLIEDLLGNSHGFENPLRHHPITSIAEAKKAAYELKEAWRIGQDAIYNAVDLLEEKHIKVIEIDDWSGEFDGLATWVDQKYPMIVLSKTASVERKRFTLFHELGHIVLAMKDLIEKEKEKFCNEFASEMLLSEENLKMEVGESRNELFFEEIKNIQEKYGISISAIVYKLGEVGIISKSHVKNFFISLRMDPDFKSKIEQSRYQGIEHSSRFENLVLRALSQECISHSKASSLLGISLSALKSQFLQLV
jgi:Zn-dependent peptidase ImmA (M78 family)/DNA-binding XRE family transcriptional regulator